VTWQVELVYSVSQQIAHPCTSLFVRALTFRHVYVMSREVLNTGIVKTKDPSPVLFTEWLRRHLVVTGSTIFPSPHPTSLWVSRDAWSPSDRSAIAAATKGRFHLHTFHIEPWAGECMGGREWVSVIVDGCMIGERAGPRPGWWTDNASHVKPGAYCAISTLSWR